MNKLILPPCGVHIGWPTDDEVIESIRSVPCHYSDLTIAVVTGNIAQTVVPGILPQTKDIIFGETIVAGMWLYYDNVAQKYFKAINTVALNGNGISTFVVVGVALEGGAINQWGKMQTAGQLTLGATVVRTTPYYLSANAGNTCPFADVATGHEVVRVCFAVSTTVVQLDIKDQGLAP